MKRFSKNWGDITAIVFLIIIACALIYSAVQAWDNQPDLMNQAEYEAEIQSWFNHGIDK